MAEKIEIIPFNELGLELQGLEQMERNFAEVSNLLSEAHVVRLEKAVRYKVDSDEFREAKAEEDTYKNELINIKNSTNEILNYLETEIQNNEDLDPYSKALYGSIFCFKPKDLTAENHKEASEQGYAALTSILGKLAVEQTPILAGGNISFSSESAKVKAENYPGSHLLYLTSDEPMSIVNTVKSNFLTTKLSTIKYHRIPLFGNDNRSNIDYLTNLAENNGDLIIGEEAVEERIKQLENVAHISSILVLSSAGFNYSRLLNQSELNTIKESLVDALITPISTDDIHPGHGPKFTKRTIKGLCDIAHISIEHLGDMTKNRIRTKLSDQDISLGQLKAYSQISNNLDTIINNLVGYR